MILKLKQNDARDLWMNLFFYQYHKQILALQETESSEIS